MCIFSVSLCHMHVIIILNTITWVHHVHVRIICNNYICRIVENFRGRKLSHFGTKREFRGENFRGLLQSNYYVGLALTHAQCTRICIYVTCALRISLNFAEKTFADGSETAKDAKFFSLQSFPLHSISFDVQYQENNLQ